MHVQTSTTVWNSEGGIKVEDETKELIMNAIFRGIFEVAYRKTVDRRSGVRDTYVV